MSPIWGLVLTPTFDRLRSLADPDLGTVRTVISYDLPGVIPVARNSLVYVVWPETYGTGDAYVAPTLEAALERQVEQRRHGTGPRTC